MHNLLALPLKLNSITLFGIVLLLGLVGGELAKRTRFLPKISGYILIGFMLGPDFLNVMNQHVLNVTRIFVDISLGLILFDLGRNMDFSWLKHDYGLLLTGVTESSLTFFTIALFSHYFAGFTWLPSALAACFAMATSPAVVMMVANDLSSEGPVTRRTLMLTSINNFIALTLFTCLLPLTVTTDTPIFIFFKESGYMLFGSLALALFVFVLIRSLAAFIGKQKDSQLILFISALILTIGIARILDIPTALTLFFLGVATRNLDLKHDLMEINFESSAQLFFILLFVVTGTHLRLAGLQDAMWTVILFIFLRGLAKFTGIWIFSRASRLTTKQVFAIGLALTPMAGLAISMSNVLEDFNPDINRKISILIAAVVAILEILGPIATQFAFIKSNETLFTRYK